MPRIPTRTEPYSSPARQQRHFKSKRDRTLKALGSASYINGSQFAVILVSAKGEVETYASELFKSKLGQWFDEPTKSEASRIVLDDRVSRANAPRHQHAVEVEIADEDGGVYSVSGDVLAMRTGSAGPDEESRSPYKHHVPITPEGSPTPSPSRPRLRPQLSAVDVALANQIFADGIDVEEQLTPSSSTLTPSTTDTVTSINSGSSASPLDEWFCNQFHRLQQTTTKLVAKCWIKVIEPKKQNKFPYQKGDASKPDWWPQTLRHKEPDHLLKAERNSLLLAILNSGRVPVARLEHCTMENIAQIDENKVPILREIFDMAKEQEMRRKDPKYQLRIPLTFIAATSRDVSPAEEKHVDSAPATIDTQKTTAAVAQDGEQTLWAHHMAQAQLLLQHQHQQHPEQQHLINNVALSRSESLSSKSSTTRRRATRNAGQSAAATVPSESPFAVVEQCNRSRNSHIVAPIPRAIAQSEIHAQPLAAPWDPSGENQYPATMAGQTFHPPPFRSFTEPSFLPPPHPSDHKELQDMLSRTASMPMLAPHELFQLVPDHHHFVGGPQFPPMSPNSAGAAAAAAAHWMMQWNQLPQEASSQMPGFVFPDVLSAGLAGQQVWPDHVQMDENAITEEQHQDASPTTDVQAPSSYRPMSQEGDFDQMTASWLLSSVAS
ncbi:hypothetical protein FRB96_008811 [Tulasnella sp. 330]|nr:hypothetical protein FRB96_008811 [Tulasnella sp. 330]